MINYIIVEPQEINDIMVINKTQVPYYDFPHKVMIFSNFSFLWSSYEDNSSTLPYNKTLSLYLFNTEHSTEESIIIPVTSDTKYNNKGIAMINNEKLVLATDINDTSIDIYTYTIPNPKCEDITFSVQVNSTYELLVLSPGDIEETIKFDTTLNDTLGDFYSNNELVIVNQLYPSTNKFVFKAKIITGDFVFAYIISPDSPVFQTLEAKCQINVKIDFTCHRLCSSCHIVPFNDNDHQCIDCNTGYYKFNDSSSTNCYNSITANVNWYLNETLRLYMPCSLACLGCTATETLTDGKYNTFCNGCAIDSKEYIDRTQCRNEKLKEDFIGYNQTSQKYENCYSKCSSCALVNSNTSMNCLTCPPDKKYISDSKNCVLNDTVSKDGYYPCAYQDYCPCYETCQTCNIPGDAYIHNCISCTTNLYFHQEELKCIDFSSLPNPNDGYYIDTIKQIVVPCYSSCATCNGTGTEINHFCVTCVNKYYLLKTSNTSNCYKTNEIVEDYYLNTISSPYTWGKCLTNCKTCSNNNSCTSCLPDTFSLDNLCYKSCPDKTHPYNSTCVFSCPGGVTMVNGQCFDLFAPTNDTSNSSSGVKESILPKDDVINIITKDLDLFTKEETIIKGSDFNIQIISKENQESAQKNAEENKLTTANLDPCIFELTKNYSIDENDILILKTDKNVTNSSINSVEFQFYSKNGTKLDHEIICNEVEIKINFPIVNTSNINITTISAIGNQGYDPFNAKSPFYNDLCTPFNGENDVDVTLEARKTDLFPNITLCQPGCTNDFTNVTSMTTTCSCKLQANDLTLGDITNTFLDEIFTNNFFVVKCYELVFDIKLLLNNIGFWVLCSFVALSTIFIAIIAIKGFRSYILVLELPRTNPPKNGNQRQLPMKEDNNDNEEEKIRRNYINPNHLNTIELNIKHPTTNNNFIDSPQASLNSNTLVVNRKQFIGKDDEDFSVIGEILFRYREDIQQIIPQHYCMILWRNITGKHPLWNTFIANDYVEFRLLKIIIFFNQIGIDFALNSMYYRTAYVNKRYETNGALDFFFSLPKSIFACLTGLAINIIFNLALAPTKQVKEFVERESNKRKKKKAELYIEKQVPVDKGNKIIQSKTALIPYYQNNNKNDNQAMQKSMTGKEEYDNEMKQIIKSTKIRLVIYLILNYLLLIFLWYFTACFCAVYCNSQIDWLIGSFISLGIGMSIPLVIAFIIASIKWLSIKCKCQTLYTVNELISSFF